jgi:hypothetical protein
MLDLESMIVEKWSALPADGRSVRAVQAALEAGGIKIGRTTVHKAITAHKKGIAREIVVEEIGKTAQAATKAIEISITPAAQAEVLERTKSVLDLMEDLAAGLSRAALYALANEGKPSTTAEVVSITTALTGYGDMLTRAHIARGQMQASRDEIDRRVAVEPAQEAPAPIEAAKNTPLARTLRQIHAEDAGT